LIRDSRENLSFEKGLNEEKRRIAENYVPLWHYVEAGRYYNQIKAFTKAFPQNQLVIFSYEELKSSFDEVIDRICEFIGISKEFPRDTSRYNQSGIPKSKRLHQFLKKKNLFKSIFKLMIPSKVRKKLVTKVMNRNLNRIDPLNEIEKKKIYESYFKEDIEKLESMLNREFKSWHR